MRSTLLATAAIMGLAFAIPAFAQTATDPTPADPSRIHNGTPAAGTSSGASPATDPTTNSNSGNIAPPGTPLGTPQNGESSGQSTAGQMPDQTSSSTPSAAPAAPGQAAATPQDQGASASADQSTPPATHHQHMHHSMTASGTDAEGSGHWAHQPGTGESGPASAKASNIDSADTRSAIAPHLPQPQVGDNAGPFRYLHDAERALEHHRSGEAQQALEMAETRLLDRSTPADAANQADQNPLIAQVTNARKALASGDMAGARSAIQTALADHRGDADNMGQGATGDTGAMNNTAPVTSGAVGAGTGGGPMGTPSADSAGGSK